MNILMCKWFLHWLGDRYEATGCRGSMCSLLSAVTGSIHNAPVEIRNNWSAIDDEGVFWMPLDHSFEIPEQNEPDWTTINTPWFERSNYDKNSNGIHDSIESSEIPVGMGISYGVELTSTHLTERGTTWDRDSRRIGINRLSANWNSRASLAPTLAGMDDVVMIHHYGNCILRRHSDTKRQSKKFLNIS